MSTFRQLWDMQTNRKVWPMTLEKNQKNQATETIVWEVPAIIFNEDVKVAITNMFKELKKENMFKGVKYVTLIREYQWRQKVHLKT
jgi:hypothetical protein